MGCLTPAVPGVRPGWARPPAPEMQMSTVFAPSAGNNHPGAANGLALDTSMDYLNIP